MGIEIEHDELRGTTDGEETVMRGLDLMADALIGLKDLDLGAAPLDEVLAEIGADDELVERVGALIERIGQAGYTGGLAGEDAKAAEELRSELYDDLDALLRTLEVELGNA